MTNLEKLEMVLKKHLGDPLPELPEIYNESYNFFDKGSVVDNFLPYMFRMMYTEDEMHMVVALPGTVEEISLATGFPKSYVLESMEKLTLLGRVLKNSTGYAKLNPRMPFYMDFQFHALSGNKREKLTEADMDHVWLFYLAQKNSNDVPEEVRATMPRRVIPKWRAIKNVPGVMECEDMRAIMMANAEKGSVATVQCLCNYGPAVWEEKCYPGSRGENPNYLNEGCTCEDGHCLFFGNIAKYYQKNFNAHTPSAEELERKLAETEDAVTVYCTSDSRDTDGNICCCNFDYCFPWNWQNWSYKPSRFQPYRRENKCVSCGHCADICPVAAIDKETLSIDLDKCLGCGNCVTHCEHNALKMKLVHTTDWIPDIMTSLNTAAKIED